MSNYKSEDESFWEPSNYKSSIKRIGDGNKLCTDLKNLISERAKIEKEYANSLRRWQRKWDNSMEKGNEYGTMFDAFKAVFSEAERVAQMHTSISEDLLENEVNRVTHFQKDNFRKGMVGLGDSKQIDAEYKKVQASWINHLKNLDKAKAEYRKAFRDLTMDTAEEQISENSSLPETHVKRIRDRTQKARIEFPKCHSKYKQTYREMVEYKSVYVREMTEIFNKCEAIEEFRKRFFKQILLSMQRTLNSSEYKELPVIYSNVIAKIEAVDHVKDLKCWSIAHGVDMPLSLPKCIIQDDSCT